MITASTLGTKSYLVNIAPAEQAPESLDHQDNRGLREHAIRVRSAGRHVSPDLAGWRPSTPTQPGHDLAAAMVATGHDDREGCLVLGELSLDGQVRAVRGIAGALLEADGLLPRAIVPPGYGALGEVLSLRIDVREAATLEEACGPFDALTRSTVGLAGTRRSSEPLDFADVRGPLAGALRALEVAAVGGHSILLVGPPGCGKTMLARRAPSILPPLTLDERRQIARIHDAAGLLDPQRPIARPFRAPHHTASASAMLGGGRPRRPGELSLAHGGVLFLDDVPEFRRDVIEALPYSVHADLGVASPRMVIGGAAPCPCGHAGDPTRICTCSASSIERYRERAMRYPWDMVVHVPLVPRVYKAPCELDSSEVIAERVAAAIWPQGISSVASSIGRLDRSDKITQEHQDEAAELTRGWV